MDTLHYFNLEVLPKSANNSEVSSCPIVKSVSYVIDLSQICKINLEGLENGGITHLDKEFVSYDGVNAKNCGLRLQIDDFILHIKTSTQIVTDDALSQTQFTFPMGSTFAF